MNTRKYLYILLGCMLLINAGISQDLPPANELYNNALQARDNKNWSKTAELLQQFIDNYPDNRNQDDALYWLGNSYQKTEAKYPQAFETYGKLIENHPESKWTDEATTNQIYIAEQLAQKGALKYQEFLVEKLGSENTDAKHEAALALGKLGDEQAIPVLQDMIRDTEVGPLAEALIANIDPDAISKSAMKERFKERIKTDKSNEKPADEETASIEEGEEAGKKDRPFLWFFKRNYAFYDSMLKTDDSWSQEDLIDYGLWVILESQEFQEYYELDSDQKREWMIENWKDADPNPNTPVNEALREFERRVQYAYENYSEHWNYRQFKYLRDQYQREGWPNAPWDARGDIYVKYGEPDFATIGNGLNWVEWTYFRFNIDFQIKKYMTNVYGNAIEPGPMVQQRFWSYFDLSEFEWDYIYNKEFYYP